MKKMFVLAFSLSLLLALTGCGHVPDTDMSDTSSVNANKIDAIPFNDDQLYAVAYLGYEEINELSFYEDNYLDDKNLPVHYISEGEYYLIIPRHANMELRLYRNDLETMGQILIYEDTESRPFILRCNVSDIFPNATIRLAHQSETVEFSPYISLKDGSVMVGEHGLDITRPPH